MEVQIEKSWKQALVSEFEKDYFKTLTDTVRSEYLTQTVYPPPKLIFNAFSQTPFETVKVVILGQDPYHGPDQAMGLSFSVPEDQRVPPSLQNIYKEIRSDIGTLTHDGGDLTEWAKQGVLLLNATLTVRASEAGTHQDLGWETFTDAAIQALSDQREHIVFLLWGAYAGKKASLIDNSKHLILTAPHPSPLSAHRGFLGCKHFSKTNDYLEKNKRKPIRW